MAKAQITGARIRPAVKSPKDMVGPNNPGLEEPFSRLGQGSKATLGPKLTEIVRSLWLKVGSEAKHERLELVLATKEKAQAWLKLEN